MNRSKLAFGLMFFSCGLSITITSNISRLVILMKTAPLTSIDQGQEVFILVGLMAMLVGSIFIASAFPEKP